MSPSSPVAPVTACLIVNDDPHLPKTLACLAPHVAEIVVVYTGQDASAFKKYELQKKWIGSAHAAPAGPVPGASPAGRPVGEEFALSSSPPAGGARRAGVSLLPHVNYNYLRWIFDHFTHASRPDGTLFDFAAARNRSFALATQPWVLWADSDDLIDGLEHLPEVIANLETASEQSRRDGRILRLCCPYEYAYDAEGRCIRLVVRERIVKNVKGAWKWKRPVHERLEAFEGADCLDLYEPRLVWKHQGAPPGRSTSARNLKILLDYVLRASSANVDALTLFDLGREYQQAPDDPEGGGVPEAVECFEKYLQIAKTGEERAAACLHLSELWWRREAPTMQQKGLTETLAWTSRAVREAGRFEDWYAYAKIQWVQAIVYQVPAMYELARRTAERALSVPTEGRYDSNPRDRTVGIVELLADCKEQSRTEILVEHGGLTAKLTRRRGEAKTPQAGAASPAGRLVRG